MLDSALLVALCTLTWLAWVPAVILQKRARGDAGGTSVFPVLPLFPLAGIALGLGGDRLYPHAGTYVVCAVHALLLLCFAFTIARSSVALPAGK